MKRIVENFITTIALTFEIFLKRLKSQVHSTTPECRSPRTLTRYNYPEDKQTLGDVHSQSISFPNLLAGSDIALPRVPPSHSPCAQRAQLPGAPISITTHTPTTHPAPKGVVQEDKSPSSSSKTTRPSSSRSVGLHMWL